MAHKKIRFTKANCNNIVTGVSLGVNEKSNTLVEISRKVCNSDKNKHVTSYETIMAKTNQWQLHNTNKHYGVHV